MNNKNKHIKNYIIHQKSIVNSVKEDKYLDDRCIWYNSSCKEDIKLRKNKPCKGYEGCASYLSHNMLEERKKEESLKKSMLEYEI